MKRKLTTAAAIVLVTAINAAAQDALITSSPPASALARSRPAEAVRQPGSSKTLTIHN
jgi:hypothetical protein